MNFSDALTALKSGATVTRHGWNGRNMWLTLADGGTFKDIEGYVQGDLEPFIVMRTAQATFVPWLASQTDLLADDWEEGAR